VVELAWAVLEAAAAAGQFDGSSSSSDRSVWNCHIAAVERLAAVFSRELASAYMQSSTLALLRPHAQQFSSDTLLKLLLLPAGLFVRELHRKQQEQQGQVCVQPYHQQLLAELRLELNEQQCGISGADTGQYSELLACAALAFALKMRSTAVQSSSGSSSGSSGSSSGSEQSVGAGVAAQPAAAVAAAATAGISSRLYVLLLLTMLEYAVLESQTDVCCLAQALTFSGDVYGCVCALFSSTAAAGGSAAAQQSQRPASDVLLQALVLEVGPEALRATRCATVAGSAGLAAMAAADGSAAAEEALAVSVERIWRSLLLLFEGALVGGELLSRLAQFYQRFHLR
jgi:hypothetical protein